MSEVLAEVRNDIGFITLNRPRALNALSLGMIRLLAQTLQAWRDEPAIHAVAIRGTGKEGPFGAFCAGGDIRFFHQAVLTGDARLEDFFTEEYRLNHLIHHYPKPYIAFMDGIVMGGGMGITQGASLRIVTPRTKMAMPETTIGLFPDVGGGWFLGRCPGRVGEYLALTGDVVSPQDAIAARLADMLMPWDALPALWETLAVQGIAGLPAKATMADFPQRELIDGFFGLPTAGAIVLALEADGSEWAARTALTLRKRSPLMLAVTLEQLRRARDMNLAQDLRMERDLVHNCFHQRPGTASETMEGIRALAVDKDNNPKWNPTRVEDVTPAMVELYFASPWTPGEHPLRDLAS